MCSDDPINPDVLVDVFLTDYPQAANVFVAHAMACVGCPIGGFHTLAEAAEIYNLDLRAFLQAIQAEIGTGSQSKQQTAD